MPRHITKSGIISSKRFIVWPPPDSPAPPQSPATAHPSHPPRHHGSHPTPPKYSRVHVTADPDKKHRGYRLSGHRQPEPNRNGSPSATPISPQPVLPPLPQRPAASTV